MHITQNFVALHELPCVNRQNLKKKKILIAWTRCGEQMWSTLVIIFGQCKINYQPFLIWNFRKLHEILSHKRGFANGNMLHNTSCRLFISLPRGRDNKFVVTAFFNNNSHILSCFNVSSMTIRCTKVWAKQWGSIYCCYDVFFFPSKNVTSMNW